MLFPSSALSLHSQGFSQNFANFFELKCSRFMRGSTPDWRRIYSLDDYEDQKDRNRKAFELI